MSRLGHQVKNGLGWLKGFGGIGGTPKPGPPVPVPQAKMSYQGMQNGVDLLLAYPNTSQEQFSQYFGLPWVQGSIIYNATKVTIANGGTAMNTHLPAPDPHTPLPVPTSQTQQHNAQPVQHLPPTVSGNQGVTSMMTPQELRNRRLWRVEQAKGLVEHRHIKVMLVFLDWVCVIGPFWILLFTTSEVGQLFTKKAFNMADQTSLNVYGAALFGEVILAGLTFISQYMGGHLDDLERDSEAYKRLRGKYYGVTALWLIFAGISAAASYVYYVNLWHPQNLLGHAVVVGRVSIYTFGEYACAKYLCWRRHTLEILAREEQKRGEIYLMMEQQEATRIQKEAEAELHLRQVQLNLENQEHSAKMAHDTQSIISNAAVSFLGQFTRTLDAVMNGVLENVNRQLAEAQKQGEVNVTEVKDKKDEM